MAEADFSGYVTKAGLKCTDGRTIRPEAFQHMDQITVPLVWQHGHSSAENVLGHAVLEARPDGVYGYGYFNDTKQGENARALVEHGDIKALSIYANKLIEKSKQVFHGFIREVSLCLAGANPGAFIDNVVIRHGDGLDDEILEDEAIIYTGQPLEHNQPGNQQDKKDDKLEHSTVQEVYDTFTDEQKQVVNFMIGAALEKPADSGDAKHSDTEGKDDKTDGEPAGDNEGDLNHQEGTEVTRNVFEQNQGGQGQAAETHTLTHDDLKSILKDAESKGSMKAAIEDYAMAHGISDIDVLFPEAKNITATPEFDKRRTEWVAGVLSGTRKSPFSRIKSIVADITQDQARAKGYIKGNLKKEEWFGVSKRTTGPTTVYKKQKLDRDDIIDITDFDVVAWMKGEMRLMLEEELARSVLIGDGRDVSDEDHIQDPLAASSGNGVRSILNEHELYAATLNIGVADNYSNMTNVVDKIIEGMQFYKGTGMPTLYTTRFWVTKMLLLRDSFGHRVWKSRAELADEMGVASIVDVEPMQDQEPNLIGIIVNLSDYNIGADRGGEVSFFDDFDIDYNQYKYLYETRISGALVKIRSALILRKVDNDDTLLTPTEPTFVSATGVVTIPTQTGVTYKNSDTGATLSAGAQSALAPGATLNVIAVANASYYFDSNQKDQWHFTRPA
jgi:hypothetical protein